MCLHNSDIVSPVVAQHGTAAGDTHHVAYDAMSDAGDEGPDSIASAVAVHREQPLSSEKSQLSIISAEDPTRTEPSLSRRIVPTLGELRDLSMTQS